MSVNDDYVKALQENNPFDDEREMIDGDDNIIFTAFLLIIVIVVALSIIFFSVLVARADTVYTDYTDEEICIAIFYAEGGDKATYLYGIRSVGYDSIEEAEEICIETVKNNRKRYEEYGYKEYESYLPFLASRYCPVGVSNDPSGLNKNFLKNVKYFLSKNRGLNG